MKRVVQTVDTRSDEDALLHQQEGCWELRTTTESAERRYGLHSYIVHVCPVEGFRRYWWYLPMTEAPCGGCWKQPPDEIYGLWKLHNWEYIQKGVTG